MQYTRLTREERHTIEALRRQEIPIRKIAETINRSASTVSRELRRNAESGMEYCYQRASDLSHSRKHGAGMKYGIEVWERVETKLREHWSPEQITGYFRAHKYQTPCHERIYQYVLHDKKTGGNLHSYFRHRVKSYRKRGAGKERRGRIKDQVMIDERPAEVEKKERVGDWELDTVIGRQGGSVLVTMVERKSRYTIIRKASCKEARLVAAELFAGLSEHKGKLFTLTADNGKEFAEHKLVSKLLGCSFYFAHPYHSWERGLNENTNGLIRQYFPKKFDLNAVSDEEIQRVQCALNSRPRKCLAFKTPNDIFKPPQPVALAS